MSVDEEARRAAEEAGRIGGRGTDDELDPAQRPVTEAGGGVAEGFELAERDLIEHASHGDQHAARRVIQDAPTIDEDRADGESGEADGGSFSGSPDG